MKSEPIVDIDLGPHNGILKLFSVSELRDFLESESRYWSWLSSDPVRGSFQNITSTINSSFHQIRNQFANVGDGSDPGKLHGVQNAMQQAFRNTRIPLSGSAIGEFIGELRGESPHAAAAALASWMNAGAQNLAQFDHFRGMFLLAAFHANITEKTPSAVKRSLEKLHTQFQESRAKTESETTAQREEFSAEKARQRSAVATLLRQARQRMAAIRDKQQQLTDDAIARISETEILYREHMKIKGPVEYWSKKADNHRQKSAQYRKYLLLFSTFAGIALLVGLYCLADRIVTTATNDKPAAVYLTFVTLGVILTTIVFWAARVLTRLFLSEHHLAIDADERSVMAQTYLALTAEGQATEQERAIVLGSLFRPTADGIIKDDAAPDISTASFLSKIGAR